MTLLPAPLRPKPSPSRGQERSSRCYFNTLSNMERPGATKVGRESYPEGLDSKQGTLGGEFGPRTQEAVSRNKANASKIQRRAQCQQISREEMIWRMASGPLEMTIVPDRAGGREASGEAASIGESMQRHCHEVWNTDSGAKGHHDATCRHDDRNEQRTRLDPKSCPTTINVEAPKYRGRH